MLISKCSLLSILSITWSLFIWAMVDKTQAMWWYSYPTCFKKLSRLAHFPIFVIMWSSVHDQLTLFSLIPLILVLDLVDLTTILEWTEVVIICFGLVRWSLIPLKPTISSTLTCEATIVWVFPETFKRRVAQSLVISLEEPLVNWLLIRKAFDSLFLENTSCIHI